MGIVYVSYLAYCAGDEFQMTLYELGGWIGNIFIIGGLWGIGNKVRNAFLLSIVGEGFWIALAYQRHDWALFSVCWVFLFMAVRGWVKWKW